VEYARKYTVHKNMNILSRAHQNHVFGGSDRTSISVEGGELIDNRKKNRLSKLVGKKNRVTGNNISSAAAACGIRIDCSVKVRISR